LVPSHALYRMATSRWEIEHEIFTVAKTSTSLLGAVPDFLVEDGE
jgi:hypothetical protein